jgi:sterol 3beta-glucosyltransferase
MDFSETIEVKTIDQGDHYSVDSYFFAYFQDLSVALEQIRDAIRTYRSIPGSPSPQPVLDTTTARTSHSPLPTTSPLPNVTDSAPRTTSVFRFTSLLRPLQDSLPLIRTAPSQPAETTDDYTHISKKPGSSFLPIISTSPEQSRDSPFSPENAIATTGPSPAPAHHTYPPANAPSASIDPTTSASRESGGWVSSWLKMPSRRLLSSPFSGSSRPPIEHSASVPVGTGAGGVSEVLTTHASLSASRNSGEYGFFSILEAPEIAADAEAVDKFRSYFAFDEKERLLGCMFYYLIVCTSTQMSTDRFPWIYFPPATSIWPSLCFHKLPVFSLKWPTDFPHYSEYQ